MWTKIHGLLVVHTIFAYLKLRWNYISDLNITYSAEVFQQYKDKLLEIGRDGPVLFHCAIGKRAGKF